MAAMASGAISGCPTQKSYGLLCFTKNLNYALDVVADRTPVNTAVYQTLNSGDDVSHWCSN